MESSKSSSRSINKDTESVEKLGARLTRKQKAIADIIMADKKISGTQAALDAGYTKNGSRHVARQLARETLQNPAVLAYMNKASDEAEHRIIGLMKQRKNNRLAFDASKDILDRVHGKAVQKSEVKSQSIQVNVNLASKE
jgi:phage terminase small subunit